MKRNLKKAMAAAMATAMASSSMVALGAEVNETGYPITNEEITVTIAGPMPSGCEDWTQVAVLDEFANRLGIRLDADFYQTDWSTRLTLMVAGDELPDMLAGSGSNIGDINKWGAEGYFLNLNDYIDLMPNLKKYFEKYPELEAYCTTSDGSIYGLPKLRTDMTDRLPRTFINRNWLENLGLDVPTSIDELYNVLVAFKEQDANGNGDTTDEIPMLFTPEAGGYSAVMRTLQDAFGIYSSSTNYILQADADNKVYLANTTDAYKEYLKFLHKLYDEELMETEAFTITGEEITDKEQGDVYGFFGCGSAPFVMANKDISYDANWVGVAGLTSALDDTQSIGVSSPVENSIIVAINANTENPEALARFVDYFYTDEGILAASKGYEGVTLEFVHNDLLGVDVPTMYVPEGYSSGEEFRYKGAVLNEAFNLVNSDVDRAALFTVDTSVLQDEGILNTFGWAAIVADANRREGISEIAVYPTVAYTTEESDERLTLYKDINTYLEQARAQFITGEVDIDEGWDTFTSTLDQMGLERLLEIEQTAYDRFVQVNE